MRRVNSLSKWFENCRHALASDFFFARVHKALRRDPAMAAGVVERILGKEACVSVIGAPGARCWKFEYPWTRHGRDKPGHDDGRGVD